MLIQTVSDTFTPVVLPSHTVYPKKYAHGVCFAVLYCGYILTDFPISIRLTSLALWQSNDCPSASKTTLMNMDKYFMWIHYERLHNHNKAKHNKTVCIFLGIYCSTTFLYPCKYLHPAKAIVKFLWTTPFQCSWMFKQVGPECSCHVCLHHALKSCYWFPDIIKFELRITSLNIAAFFVTGYP